MHMFRRKPPNGKVIYVTTVMGGATRNAVQSLGISPQGEETAHADNLADLIIQSSTYPMVTHMLATQYMHQLSHVHSHTHTRLLLVHCLHVMHVSETRAARWYIPTVQVIGNWICIPPIVYTLYYTDRCSV